MGKGKRKMSAVIAEEEQDKEEIPASTRTSDEPIPKKVKWTNKQRVLVFSSRGIGYRHRHLIEDLKTLLPHTRSESKMEKKDDLSVINEICEMANCNKCLFFEGRKAGDLYMWMSNIPYGPSVKFLVENIYTMGELKLTGNCLKGSRPLLSFDPLFGSEPHYEFMRELFIQVFGTPNHHPKSQPFVDHVLTFSILDDRIWIRNFQILSEEGALAEIGPRFVVNPIKIFDKSFEGDTIWDNPHFVAPAKRRQLLAKQASGKYMSKVGQEMHREATRPETSYGLNKLDEIFAEELPFEDKETNDLRIKDDGSKKLKKKKSKHFMKNRNNRVKA